MSNTEATAATARGIRQRRRSLMISEAMLRPSSVFPARMRQHAVVDAVGMTCHCLSRQRLVRKLVRAALRPQTQVSEIQRLALWAASWSG